MGKNRELNHNDKVTGKKTSAHNTNWMKFGFEIAEAYQRQTHLRN